MGEKQAVRHVSESCLGIRVWFEEGPGYAYAHLRLPCGDPAIRASSLDWARSIARREIEWWEDETSETLEAIAAARAAETGGEG